ncbi:MAG: ferritin-like domain-containing protein [Planctomycetes bacterium]|nr:ferritin-like domain-containing protein [Planctomycetota bacterium]
MKPDNQKVIEILNELLSQEYAQYIEMATQASVTAGEESLYLKSFFEGQAAGSLKHAELLRERIFFLGGIPTTKVGDTTVFATSREAISAGTEDHKRFVELYRSALTAIKRTDGNILYETIEEILEGEQEDLESFIRISGSPDSHLNI